MYLNKCNSWVWTIWIEDKLATLLTRRPKIGATDQQPKTSKREKKSSNGAISSRAHTRCMKFKIADIANTDHCSCWNCNIKMDQLLSIPAPSSREGSLSFPQKRVFVIPHSTLDSEHFAIVFLFLQHLVSHACLKRSRHPKTCGKYGNQRHPRNYEFLRVCMQWAHQTSSHLIWPN